MPWNIGLDGKDFNILNTELVTDSSYNHNNINYLNYFMIKEDGNIGINNKNPSAKLDINGNTIINGSVFTSNIIGMRINNSNLLKLNYTNIPDDINNLEIYGNTVFRGNITLDNLNGAKSILNINGNINAVEFKGVGSNITNITAGSINTGILDAKFGGTGINNIKSGLILYGTPNNSIEQNDTFRFVENLQTLEVLRFKGSGTAITNINADNVDSGILRGRFGGTGKSTYAVEGGILIGNIRAPDNIDIIDQSTNFRWDDRNSKLMINGGIKLSAQNFIFIDEKPLNYSHIGEYKFASSNIAGVIKWDDNSFKINNNDQLSLKQLGTSKWGQDGENSPIIYYPSKLPITNECVGIGVIPQNTENRLLVNGNINIINGVYTINGININAVNSNFLSNKIDNVTLDNIKSQFGGNNKRCFDLVDRANNIKAYRISGDNNNFIFDNKVEFVRGGDFNSDTTIESVIVTSGTLGLPNKASLIVIQKDTGANSIIAEFQSQDNLIVTSRMLLDKNGRLGIGSFSRTTLPREKLDVEGNIIATGQITQLFSDERLKIFTSKISNSLEIINNLNGYYYELNEKAIQYGFKQEKQIGLSAQEVEKYIPEITRLAPFDIMKDANDNNISKSGQSYLTICYERLGPVFVEAIKELTNEIKELKKDNILIRKELENIRENR